MMFPRRTHRNVFRDWDVVRHCDVLGNGNWFRDVFYHVLDWDMFVPTVATCGGLAYHGQDAQKPHRL